MLANPELKAYYASLAGPKQNAYNLALKDAYQHPEIQNINVTATDVAVTAENEFPAAEVKVQAIDVKGILIERSQAVFGRNGADWYYKTAALPPCGKLKVIVADLIGHTTVKELLLTEERPSSLDDELLFFRHHFNIPEKCICAPIHKKANSANTRCP